MYFYFSLLFSYTHLPQILQLFLQFPGLILLGSMFLQAQMLPWKKKKGGKGAKWVSRSSLAAPYQHAPPQKKGKKKKKDCF